MKAFNRRRKQETRCLSVLYLCLLVRFVEENQWKSIVLKISRGVTKLRITGTLNFIVKKEKIFKRIK